MEVISKQEYLHVLLELDLITTKFIALKQENRRFLWDLQQLSVEKEQQYDQLSQQVQKLELILLSLWQQRLGS